MIYSALVEDEGRAPHLRKVLVVGVRDEKDARRLLWEGKFKVVSFGRIGGVEVLIGDWRGEEGTGTETESSVELSNQSKIG